MASLTARALFLVTFNILRVLCKKYGLYLFIALVLVVFQGFSGYYVVKLGGDDKLLIGRQRSLPEEKDGAVEREEQNIESRIYLNGDRGDADHHNKGPPVAKETDENEISWMERFGFQPPCSIYSKETISAVNRASTLECKRLITNISCQVTAGTFYPTRLPSYCPSNGQVRGKYMGCFLDSREERILKGHGAQLRRNTPLTCADICYQRGYIYAGVQYSRECFCGNEDLPLKKRVKEGECDMPCSGDNNLFCGGFLRIAIFETGLGRFIPQAIQDTSSSNGPYVRVVFLLTVNGRALRQVKRLFKALFHKDHYFYIHVDSRQDYLYRELLKLEATYNNVRLSRYRRSSIWGGASLLSVLLHCMKEVLLFSDWHWDFVINLSESDYPIKTNSELVNFLTANRDRNFLKSHGHDTNKFLQKQGLDRTFLECETHMWRVGERKLPLGIRVDGGSDWLCLNRQFVNYVVSSRDQLVTGLKKIYSYTLLPAESFFHTVLRNSKYCQTFTDNNLHVTNWKRKLGCKCQYKHIVDWCGCSPNDFTLQDWGKLQASKSRNLFFARKFEASVCQNIINKVDAWLYGAYHEGTPGLNSYWENRYHHEDRPLPSIDHFLSMYHSVARISSKSIGHLSNTKDKECVVYATAIMQTHVYFAEDKYEGTLVDYLASVRDHSGFRIETWVFPHVRYQAVVGDVSHRLKGLEVGSDFDMKEQMLRNFERVLGPNSDITVVTRWLADTNLEGEGDEEPSPLSVTLLLSDPTSTSAAVADLTVDRMEQTVHHVFELQKPLVPGTWMVRVLIDKTIIGALRFLIMPLQFVQGRQISVKEARIFHGGPKSAYSEDDLSQYDSVVGSQYSGNTTALQFIKSRSHLYGPKLSDWIDELVSGFYTIQDSCYVPSDVVPACVTNLLDACPDTMWSSYSPDPKSDLDRVDDFTGRIKDPFKTTW
ncbi:xylosyltransferase oxt-like [Oratosquilla oratoria]|uniref:xylosyltransferase oxt-like n=1 Tax=Oratosquilla oratoria TaxID=337810 RepID=UPI003F75E273